jgi:hypothetical protein
MRDFSLGELAPQCQERPSVAAEPRWRATNKAAEMLAYLLAPLVLPVVCAAVLWASRSSGLNGPDQCPLCPLCGLKSDISRGPRSAMS